MVRVDMVRYEMVGIVNMEISETTSGPEKSNQLLGISVRDQVWSDLAPSVSGQLTC